MVGEKHNIVTDFIAKLSRVGQNICTEQHSPEQKNSISARVYYAKIFRYFRIKRA